MKRTIIIKSLSAEVMRRIRHFGDFVTVPLASVIFIDLAGVDRLYLVLAGLAAWTLLEYLVHRFVFHRYSSVGRRLHQLHHDHPNDPDAERSSLSTPLIALPIGVLLIVTAGQDGSAIFAGLLLESVRRLQAGLQSFLSMRRIEARRKNAKAFRLRHSQSLAKRRQRLSHAMVRSTIQRFGKTTNPLT